MKTNEEAAWEIIKDIFDYVKYLACSKEEKTERNIRLVKEKYWFQQLMETEPSLYTMLENDEEIRQYVSSRKRVRKLLRDKEERQQFKELLKDRLNDY